jgi:hypothetical protein
MKMLLVASLVGSLGAGTGYLAHLVLQQQTVVQVHAAAPDPLCDYLKLQRAVQEEQLQRQSFGTVDLGAPPTQRR